MAKPCLGYRSRTDAVLALRAQGLSYLDIARRVGIDSKTASALAASGARKSYRQQAGAAAPPPAGIVLSKFTRAGLRTAAAARSLSIDALAIRLLDAIVDGELIDAVLDDRDDEIQSVDRPAAADRSPAQEVVLEARPDSLSSPEGGRATTGVPDACEPPQSRRADDAAPARERAPERVIAAPVPRVRIEPAAPRTAPVCAQVQKRTNFTPPATASQNASAAIAWLRGQRISVSVASTGVFGSRWFVATYPGAIDAAGVVEIARAKGWAG